MIASGRCRSPVENLFSIQEAKLKLARARRGLPRVPWRKGHGRARSCWARPSSAGCDRWPIRRLHERAAGGVSSASSELGWGVATGGCYSGSGRLSGTSSPACVPFGWSFCPSWARPLSCSRAACGGGDDDAAETNGSGNPDIEVPADAVAVVAGTSIPRADYDRLFAQAEEAYKAQQREFPAAGTPEYEQLKNQTVEFLIERDRVREKEAKALGITVTDQEVDDRLTELKQQFFEGDEQKYQDELEAQGVTEEDVLADLRAQLISQKIFDQVTEGRDRHGRRSSAVLRTTTKSSSRRRRAARLRTSSSTRTTRSSPTTSTHSFRTGLTSRSSPRSTRPTPPRPSRAAAHGRPRQLRARVRGGRVRARNRRDRRAREEPVRLAHHHRARGHAAGGGDAVRGGERLGPASSCSTSRRTR